MLDFLKIQKPDILSGLRVAAEAAVGAAIGRRVEPGLDQNVGYLTAARGLSFRTVLQEDGVSGRWGVSGAVELAEGVQGTVASALEGDSYAVWGYGLDGEFADEDSGVWGAVEADFAAG